MTTIVNIKNVLLERYIPKDVEGFINTSGLTERFDYANNEILILEYREDEIAGLVSYGLNKTDSGEVVPRFLHIIVAKKYRGSRVGFRLMLLSEEKLRQLGYGKVIAVILNDLPGREMKKKYAEKFGYVKYSQNDDGEYFYKTIQLN